MSYSTCRNCGGGDLQGIHEPEWLIRLLHDDFDCLWVTGVPSAGGWMIDRYSGVAGAAGVSVESSVCARLCNDLGVGLFAQDGLGAGHGTCIGGSLHPALHVFEIAGIHGQSGEP